MTAEDKVFDFISDNGLLKGGRGVLVGLSGGADSVCLLHMLYSLRERLGITVFAAHLNHGIRGEEAERDERFAKSFCEGLGVKIFVRHVDIKTEAKQRGMSEELCGREARYAFFDELSKKYDITYIATAHNMNDSAETLLMNFMRGASLNGLCGIPARRGSVIRPILCLTRSEITEYNKSHGLEYVTDSTNLSSVYTRNKIRLELIPEIEKSFNPNFTETVVKNAENMRLDKELLDELTEKAYSRCVSGNAAELSELMKEHISLRRRIIYKMLTINTGTADILAKYIDAIDALARTGRTGTSADLPSGFEAAVEYGKLIIRNKIKHTGAFEYSLKAGEETYIPELGLSVLLEETEKNGRLSFKFPEGAALAVRNRREGDVFYPEGMEGRKKLKKYFSDEKLTRAEREKTGLLTSDGEIAYIFGKRRDRRFAFKDKGLRLIIKKRK